MKKLIYIIAGVLLITWAVVTYAAPTAQNFNNIQPFQDQTYNNGSSLLYWLNTYTKNLLFATTTNGCASVQGGIFYVTGTPCGSGGSSSQPAFTPTSYGAATTTTLGFLNGFFSTASSTLSGPIFFPALSQGSLYIGTDGLIKTTATTSVTCSGSTSCTGFTVFGNSPITISSSASGGGGSVSTSSNEVANQVAVFSSNSGTPALIGGSSGLTYGSSILHVTGAVDASYLQLSEVSSISTPGAGKGFYYAKDDGYPYYKNSSGADFNLALSNSPYDIATTSNIAVPQLAYFTKTGGITTLGSVATTTLSGSGLISVTAGASVLGASPITVSCPTCGAGTVTSVTGTFPIFSSGGATPNITFGGLTTSTPAVLGNIPYFSGVNTFANVATTSVTCSGSTTCTSFTAIGGSPITISSTGGGIGDPFTHVSYLGQTTSATSTLLQLTGSPYSLAASSTSLFDNSTTTFSTIKKLWLPNITTKTLNVDASGLVYGTATSTPTVTSPITYSGTLGSFIGGVSGTFACATCVTTGTTFYDAWTHPVAGQSATTSLMLLNGNASTTGLSAGYAYFGTTATSSFSNTGVLTLATTTSGCASIGATGLVWSTGTPCGSGSGSSGSIGFASTTNDIQSIYMYGTGQTFFRGNSSVASSSRSIVEINAPGNIMPLYIGSSTSLFEIETTGNVGIASSTAWKQLSVGSSNTGTFAISTSTDGCASFTKGELYSTGSACGSGGGGSGSSKWATTTITNAFGIYPAGGGYVGIGTTTNFVYPLQLASSTVPQLGLIGIATDPVWNFRSIGGSLYVATSTNGSTATSSVSALSIDGTQSTSTNSVVNIDTHETTGPGFDIVAASNQSINLMSIYQSNGSTPYAVFGTTGRFGFGTSTPFAGISVVGDGGVIVAFASSTATGASKPVFEIDANGHPIYSGKKPTCDGNCTLVAGNDARFRIKTGTTITTTTVTFAFSWGTLAPICQATEGDAGTVSAGASSTPTTLVLTFASALSAKDIDISCDGIQ